MDGEEKISQNASQNTKIKAEKGRIWKKALKRVKVDPIIISSDSESQESPKKSRSSINAYGSTIPPSFKNPLLRRPPSPRLREVRIKVVKNNPMKEYYISYRWKEILLLGVSIIHFIIFLRCIDKSLFFQLTPNSTQH